MFNKIISINNDERLLSENINVNNVNDINDNYNYNIEYQEINLLNTNLIKRNNKKINVIFALMLTLLTLQLLNLISIFTFISFVKKINLSGLESINSINTTEFKNYTHKFKNIVDYLCNNYIQC